MKIRCQIKMIDYRQVDVEVEKDISPALLIKAIEEQAKREFGESDRIEVVEVENASLVIGGV